MKNLISLLLIVLIFLFSASACEQSSPPSDPPNRIVIDTSEDGSSVTNSEVYSDVAKAAIAVAEAYLDHTVFIQYDQLSMNRVLRNSPRYEFVTPETASSQRFVYMECGVFVRNVYKNVMGYTAPKAGDILDTAYPNVNGERVFHWIGRDNQSPADEQKALSEMLNILVPGDVIYYNYTSNNHIMLYIGNGEVIHCTYGHNKGGGDYSYSAKTDKEEPEGALLRDDLTELIEKRDMFNSKNSVCVLRPSEMGYPITRDAEIRTEKLQDIVIFKTSSAPLGISVNPGDTVEVYIKGLDREKGKISLGFKRIEDNPWEILKRDYPVGTETDVKIVKLTTFGVFAEIFPGMEGLIHISQIAYERIEKPQDVLSIDETVKVKIIEIDSEKRKIALSIKALLPAPEKKVVEEAPEEDAAPVTMSIDELIAKANEEAAAAEAADAE